MRLEVAHRSNVRKMFRGRQCKGSGEARAVDVNANPTTVINSKKKFNNSTRKGLVSWPSNPRIYRQEQDCTFCRLCLLFASRAASAKADRIIVRLRQLRQSHPTTCYSRVVGRERYSPRHQGCLQNRNVVFCCYRQLLPAPRCLKHDTL